MVRSALKSTGGKVRRYPHSDRIVLSDFLDHAGNPAICAMNTFREEGLPIRRPPFSFQVYMVNGLTCSPAIIPQPLPPASDIITPTTISLSDDSTTTSREFVTAFLESVRYAQIYPLSFSLAVYFMPKNASAAECMEHYEIEREHRKSSSWPMPETYATTISDIDYRDFLLRVEPRDDASVVFGSGHPIQFVVSGASKVIPTDLQGEYPEWYSEEDKLSTDEAKAWMGVGGRVYITGSTENAGMANAEIALNTKARDNVAWGVDEESDWIEEEWRFLDKYFGIG